MSASEEESPRRLPAGAHGIPAEVVARNQRERLVAAMAEACAEGEGYAEVSVADLTRRAGLSTATFYKLFDGKRDCMVAAHQELLERLLEEVDEACAAAGGEGEQGVRRAIRTALGLFAADPPSARLLAIEILAVGREGAARHGAAVEAVAARLRRAAAAGGDPGPAGGAWIAVAGALALVGKLVSAGEAERLPALEDELVAMSVDSLSPDS